jgi:hypothetical protein
MVLTEFQDNPFYIALLFGVFSSFFTWSILDYLSKARVRQRAIQSLGAQIGFRYFRSKWEYERSGLEMPSLMRPRRSRKNFLGFEQSYECQNILKGIRDGRETYYLERVFKERGRDLETRALIGLGGIDLPFFELVPLRLFDKFHRLLELDLKELFRGPRMKRVELTGLRDFQRPRHHLWVEAAEEGRIRGLFPREFLEYLLRFPNWRIKARGNWMMVFEENWPIPPEKWLEFADQVSAAVGILLSQPPLSPERDKGGWD